MKYFRWPPDFIHKMTWSNFMLYMSSIPSYSDEETNPKMETVDASILF